MIGRDMWGLVDTTGDWQRLVETTCDWRAWGLAETCGDWLTLAETLETAWTVSGCKNIDTTRWVRAHNAEQVVSTSIDIWGEPEPHIDEKDVLYVSSQRAPPHIQHTGPAACNHCTISRTKMKCEHVATARKKFSV